MTAATDPDGGGAASAPHLERADAVVVAQGSDASAGLATTDAQERHNRYA